MREKAIEHSHLGRVAIQSKRETEPSLAAFCLTVNITGSYAHWHDHGTVPAHHGRGWHQRGWDRSIDRCVWGTRSDCTTCNPSRTKHRELLFALSPGCGTRDFIGAGILDCRRHYPNRC